MAYELTKREHDGLAVGDKVRLAAEPRKNARQGRVGVVIVIYRPRPRGAFRFNVAWNAGPHPLAPATLYRSDLEKLPKRSR